MAEEEKITWNMRVFRSVADKFNKLADRGYRGKKSVMATAACLAFISMSDDERQQWVNIVKLAEGRGLDGTVADAAAALTAELDMQRSKKPPGDVAGKIGKGRQVLDDAARESEDDKP